MTLSRFQNYIRYSTACPKDISPERWNGMLKSVRTNGYTPDSSGQTEATRETNSRTWENRRRRWADHNAKMSPVAEALFGCKHFGG